MKIKKEKIGTIKPYVDFQPRVCLDNKTVKHKDKKKEKSKKFCRKII